MSAPAEPIDELTPLQRAALVIKQLRARLDALEQSRVEPIAIIGLGCRFPGQAGDASGPEAFWELLRSGGDAISEVPPERWDVEAFYAPDASTPGKMYARWGGFLRQIDQFDPQFFGISPREARSMDPQQRLLLEVCWEALEHAGQAPDRLREQATGVFVGIGIGDYATIQTRAGNVERIDAYLGTGTGFCFASGRLSYLLGAQGPCLSVDTACSSSLVAIHLACQSLRNDECSIALAGGVNALLAPEAMLFLAKSGALSPTGRCKTFDASADGFVRSEGCGMLVLKRRSDAIADGDRILALIRGSAVNHDGPSSGLTVPNGLAQQKLIRQALRQAQVAPAQVSYVEAHGTGTALGDPIELRALAGVLGEGRDASRPLYVGSVKTNLGHMEAAAGVASMIKVVLALQHQEIPAHLHFTTPTPHHPWDALPLSVPTVGTPWPAEQHQPRIAGVSSFGLSGTNAHILLEEAPAHEAGAAAALPAHLLCLSARDAQALRALAGRFARQLARQPALSLADLCFTAGAGRAHMPERLALIGSDHAQLREQLEVFAAGQEHPQSISGHTSTGRRIKVAFLFTGQGAQYLQMGRELYETQPVFRQAFERCDELAQAWLGQSLRSVVYSDQGEQAWLDETLFTQPALFAVEYALAELWRSWGLEPAVVMGHSLGEYVAACVAGVFSLEDALKLVVARARLMQDLPQGGAMAVLLASEERVRAAIRPYPQLAIAAINGPRNVVISGPHDDVAQVAGALSAEGVRVTALKVSHAFHSPLMQPMLAEFARLSREVAYAAPRIELIANLTGQLSTGEIATPEYWVEHIVRPVQFATGVQTLGSRGCSAYLEIGPQPVLLSMARQGMSEEQLAGSIWLPSLSQQQRPWDQMLQSLGALYVHGAVVDWQGLCQGYQCRKIHLPTYPFQRQRYWIEETPLAPGAAAPAGHGTQLAPDEALDSLLYQTLWQQQPRLAQRQATGLGGWLILADSQGLGEALASLLHAQGASCGLAFAGDSYKQTRDGRYTLSPLEPGHFARLLADFQRAVGAPLQGVVSLWALDTSRAEASLATLQRTQQLLCGSTLHLVQALTQAGAPAELRLALVTCGSQPVDPRIQLQVDQAALWGLGRVVLLEHPELRCVCIDLDPAQEAAASQQLFAELLAPDGEQQIAYRGGARYVPRLQRYLPAPPALAQPVRADGSYLVTGGLGTLGLHVAEWLASQGARSLALLSRGGRSAADVPAIQRLRAAGLSVLVLEADIARADQLAAALAALKQQAPPLRGIVHTAGVVEDGMLRQQHWAQFERVMAAKVAGTWNLHTLTRELPLDFFVCFSSIATTLGSPGQANYVAANAFMDALAHQRRALGLPGLSINWGPWQDSRMEAGNQARRQAQGLAMLGATAGLRALDALVRQPLAQVAVLRVEWQRFLEQFSDELRRTFFVLIDPAAGQAGTPAPALLQQLEAAASGERRALLTTQIRALCAQVLGLAAPEQVPLRQTLFELGLDSMLAIELRNRLASSLGRALRPTVIFDYPSVEALAQHLSQEVLPTLFVAPVQGQAAPAVLRKQALIEEIDQLSEDEAAAMLLKMLGNTD